MKLNIVFFILENISNFEVICRALYAKKAKRIIKLKKGIINPAFIGLKMANSLQKAIIALKLKSTITERKMLKKDYEIFG